MSEATSSPIQPVQPLQNLSPVPQPESPKKTVSILILFLIVLILVGLSVGGYFLITRNKKESVTTSEKQSCTYNNQTYNDSDSFDATDGCNTCLCNNGTVVCTELTCNEESDNNGGSQQPAEETWKTYSNQQFGVISMRIPASWEARVEQLSSEEYMRIFELDENVLRFYDVNSIEFSIYHSAYSADLCYFRGTNYLREDKTENGVQYSVCTLNGTVKYYLTPSYMTGVDSVINMEADASLVTKESFLTILQSLEMVDVNDTMGL